jgi:hypothetical protein
VSAGFPFRGAIDALEPSEVAVIQMWNAEGEGVD